MLFRNDADDKLGGIAMRRKKRSSRGAEEDEHNEFCFLDGGGFVISI